MKKDQRGIAHLALILVIVAVAVVGAAGYQVYTKNKTKDSATGPASQSGKTAKTEALNCQPAAAGLFTKDVTDMSAITLIQTPIRLIGGSNIKTHSYIEVAKRSPVYAPMDATLNGGANYYETMGSPPVTKVQYIMAFNEGCDVSFWLDHIVDVPDKIKNAFPAEARNDTQGVDVKNVEVKAGELVGYTNQEARARFDFGAINLKGPLTSLTTNPRFKDDPIVKTSDKYRYATCPYNLYAADTQAQYRSRYDPTTSGDQEIIDDICK